MDSRHYVLACSLLTLFIFFIFIDTSTAQCVDRSDECRTMLQSHYCYLEHNRNLCCQSCKRFETGIQDCQYGDHFVKISRNTLGEEQKSKVYTCDGYVSFFGHHHCTNDPKFKEYCCKSCNAQ